MFEQLLRVGEGPFIADEYGRFVERSDFLGRPDSGAISSFGCGGRSAANQALPGMSLTRSVRGQVELVPELLGRALGHAFGVNSTKCPGHEDERAVCLAQQVRLNRFVGQFHRGGPELVDGCRFRHRVRGVDLLSFGEDPSAATLVEGRGILAADSRGRRLKWRLGPDGAGSQGAEKSQYSDRRFHWRSLSCRMSDDQ